MTNQESLNEFGIGLLVTMLTYILLPIFIAANSLHLTIENMTYYMLIQTAAALVALIVIYSSRLKYLGYSSWLLLLLPLPFGITVLTLICCISND